MLGLWATQQPQRGGTTSCASRPSAGIDRAKCLTSLKATGEQGTILSTVGRGGARRPTRRGSGNRNVVPGPGPPARNLRADFFWEFKNVGAVRAVWKELGFGWAGSSVRAGCNGNSGCDSCNEK